MKKVVVILLCVVSLFALSSCAKKIEFKEEILRDNTLKVTEIKGDKIYEDSIDGICQSLYSVKIDDVEYISSYLKIDDKVYFMGKSLNNKDDNSSKNSLMLVKTKLNNNSVYKFTEVLGASYRITSYIKIDNNVPKTIKIIDGSTYEKDIDNDNELETIAEYGTPGVQTIIYKWDFENNKVLYTYLNEDVFENSPSVYINDDSKIVVSVDGNEEYYTINNNRIEKVDK